jgi:predicted metal-dependent hydrolase
VSGIAVEVVRKEIKHLHLGVYPPHGRVRVAAPVRLRDDAIRLAVISRLGWIRRKQKAFEEQDRQSQREMLTGESHYFKGRRYRLERIDEDGPPSVRLSGHKTMELRVRPGSDRKTCELVLQRWYRLQLRRRIPPLLAKWEPRVGETVAEVRIRRMKTRWGSCNAAARRIWLNLELAKKPASCLEFILVHEMVHFLERRHDERFRERMDALLPSWRRYRDELNRAPLAHEEWRY